MSEVKKYTVRENLLSSAETTERETKILFFVESTDRTTNRFISNYSGCFPSLDEARDVMDKLIIERKKLKVRLYKVRVDAFHLESILRREKLWQEGSDIVEVLNFPGFQPFTSFLAEYPGKRDFQILETFHYIC